MSSSRVEFQFTNTLAEHVAAMQLYYGCTAWPKVDKVVSLLLLIVGVVSTSYFGFRWWTLIWFPLAVAEWFNWLSPRRLQTRMSFHRNPKFRETYHLVFTDEGIRFKTESVDSKIAWNHYKRFLEDADLFLLVYDPWMYTVIPKRVFKDDQESRAFRSLLERRLEGDHVEGVPQGGN